MRSDFVTMLLDRLLVVTVDSLVDPPPRQLVVHGAFAWDCEMVATRLERLTLEHRQGQGCAVIPSVLLTTTVLRCYPKSGDDGVDVPDEAEIAAAAHVLAVDAAGMAGGVIEAWSAGTLFPSVSCTKVSILPGVEPLGPSGGLAGWRMMLEVRI